VSGRLHECGGSGLTGVSQARKPGVWAITPRAFPIWASRKSDPVCASLCVGRESPPSPSAVEGKPEARTDGRSPRASSLSALNDEKRVKIGVVDAPKSDDHQRWPVRPSRDLVSDLPVRDRTTDRRWVGGRPSGFSSLNVNAIGPPVSGPDGKAMIGIRPTRTQVRHCGVTARVGCSLACECFAFSPG
jgi:hypothetical protein